MTLRHRIVGISLVIVIGFVAPVTGVLAYSAVEPAAVWGTEEDECTPQGSISIGLDLSSGKVTVRVDLKPAVSQASDSACVDGLSLVLLQQLWEAALDGLGWNGTSDYQVIERETHSKPCCNRGGMCVRENDERVNRINSRQEAVDLPAIEDEEPPLYRSPQRPAPDDPAPADDVQRRKCHKPDREMHRLDMLRRTKPLGLVPMVLISDDGTWTFLGSPW